MRLFAAVVSAELSGKVWFELNVTNESREIFEVSKDSESVGMLCLWLVNHHAHAAVGIAGDWRFDVEGSAPVSRSARRSRGAFVSLGQSAKKKGIMRVGQ